MGGFVSVVMLSALYNGISMTTAVLPPSSEFTLTVPSSEAALSAMDRGIKGGGGASDPISFSTITTSRSPVSCSWMEALKERV